MQEFQFKTLCFQVDAVGLPCPAEEDVGIGS